MASKPITYYDMSGRYVFWGEIEGALPNLPNRTRGAHWALVKRSRDEWGWLVATMIGQSKPAKPLDRALVKLTRRSSLQPDTDNLMASWKPLIDGLVSYGILVDDGPDHLELESSWEKKTGRGAVVVGIQEL